MLLRIATGSYREVKCLFIPDKVCTRSFKARDEMNQRT